MMLPFGVIFDIFGETVVQWYPTYALAQKEFDSDEDAESLIFALAEKE